MTKEVRNNLIFGVLLLAFMLPGGVILFRKKSQPGERPIGSPDPVRTTTAYMDPYPAETVPRLAPVKTLQWVASLAEEGGAVPVYRVVRQVEPTPGAESSVLEKPYFAQGGGSSGDVSSLLLSSGRWFQAISMIPPAASPAGGPPGPSTLRLLVWDEDRTPETGTFTVRVKDAGGDVEGSVRSSEVIAMPKAIRHDLQDAGFVMPPERITRLDVLLPAAGKIVELTFDGKNGRRKSETLTVP